jgi:hypothetical protein
VPEAEHTSKCSERAPAINVFCVGRIGASLMRGVEPVEKTPATIGRHLMTEKRPRKLRQVQRSQVGQW